MIDAAASHTDSEAGEGLMRWFEAWAAALRGGYYQVWLQAAVPGLCMPCMQACHMILA